MTVIQIFANLKQIGINFAHVVIIIITGHNFGFFHIDDTADINGGVWLKLVELFHYILEIDREIFPWIISQIIRAKHDVDFAVLSPAQPLVNGNRAFRCGNRGIGHAVCTQAYTGKEGSLGDAGRIAEAFHPGVADKHCVRKIRVIDR